MSYYGGYSSKKARELILIGAWITLAVTIPIPLVDSFEWFGILMWCLLFFGGSMLPSLTGLMLNSVPDYQRGSANSIATLSYNMLGWMPAPFVYGLVAKIMDN